MLFTPSLLASALVWKLFFAVRESLLHKIPILGDSLPRCTGVSLQREKVRNYMQHAGGHMAHLSSKARCSTIEQRAFFLNVNAFCSFLQLTISRDLRQGATLCDCIVSEY